MKVKNILNFDYTLMNMTIRNLAEAQKRLLQASMAGSVPHRPAVLERMSLFMQAIGNPHQRLNVIHIAGTSGKTSTAFYINTLLRASGKRVGLSISPYTYVLNDRLQLHGAPLPEEAFRRALSEFLSVHKQVGCKLTYMELLTAFAYWQLARLNVDYAVIETNTGGLYDATNVAARQDKVVVITDIGLDHTALLGQTLPEIARQKAGIIQKHNVAFMLRQAKPVVMPVVTYAKEQQAALTVIDTNPPASQQTSLGDIPLFQQRNWWLAKQVYEYIRQRDGLKTLSINTLKQSMTITVPGRMETVISRSGVPVILDVAHNPQKMTLLAKSLQHLYPEQAVAAMLMIGDGKDAGAVLLELSVLKPYLICSEYRYIEGLPHQALPAENLVEFAREYNLNATAVPDNLSALRQLLARKEPIKLITGSLYGVSQIKSAILDI